MQKNNVTHRDIKPQNVLVSRGVYKLCDFGDVKIINGEGVIMQPVRGSELYMSPILFYAYNKHVSAVLHNTYKSDVFSLGMCLLLASTLTSKTLYNIRELRDINIVSSIVTKALIKRYSQNIMFVNGVLKICDFGDAKILKKRGIVVQRIRGSELFMSPLVFRAYHAGMQQIQHNTYKSDVFSLGMCMLFAACLSYDGPSTIREIYDMNMIRNVLYQYLGRRYSPNFINILWTMLQVDEKKRPDFNQLQIMFNLY
jgi:serine/threonine protein kinase